MINVFSVDKMNTITPLRANKGTKEPKIDRFNTSSTPFMLFTDAKCVTLQPKTITSNE